MVNDPLGNFINSLKNASAVGKTEVSVPYSKHLHEVARVLEAAGYLANVEKTGKDTSKELVVRLVKPIKVAKRLSKPSRRLYTGSRTAPLGKGGQGITVISTPKGVMTGVEARANHVGGEILFTLV